MIHEVITDIDAEAAEIVLLVHWIGRVHSEVRLPKRRRVCLLRFIVWSSR